MGTVLLGATETGLARAEASNGTWTRESVLSGTVVRCLAADPLDARMADAGTSHGLLRSNDRGRTWAASARPPTCER